MNRPHAMLKFENPGNSVNQRKSHTVNPIRHGRAGAKTTRLCEKLNYFFGYNRI